MVVKFCPFTRFDFWLCWEIRRKTWLETSENYIMKSFTICTPRKILETLRCEDMCSEYSVHGGEENCVQSVRKQVTWRLIFHYLHWEKFRSKYAWYIPGNSGVITFLCIGLMHHVLHPHSLMNTGTTGHRIKKIYMYVPRNLTVSQTCCISSFRENYHVTNTLTNTFTRLAAAFIWKKNLSVISRFVCVINRIR